MRAAETTAAITQLVEAVHVHARTLALLAPSIRTLGVERTRAEWVQLMTEMERKFPGNREQSVYASVELSLRRLSPANQDRARVLGVFHGGVQLGLLMNMMQSEQADVASLAQELIATGLATPNHYDHLSLNPALCPYLHSQLDTAERDALTLRWVEAMGSYVEFLDRQRSQNTELAATLTGLELPNMLVLLDSVQRAGDAETTIGLTTSLHSLLRNLGKPVLLQRVGQVRDAASATLGETWSHARFEAQRTRIEQQLASRQLQAAFDGAPALLQRARLAGGLAYPEADYDLAMACFLLARVLKNAGAAEQALPLLDEARLGFESVEQNRPGCGAERMASVCLAERGDCLSDLGRLDEAAAVYEENIRRAEKLHDDRQVAISKGQLGRVRFAQRRYPEALAAYREARERFTQLDEPATVAIYWHQTGMAYQDAGQPEAAEDAYRQALAIKVRLGDIAGQASTLGQLGLLYDDALGRTEEAVAFFRLALDKYIEIHDLANEGRTRGNLAIHLRKLGRLEQARQEIRRAIECNTPFGHASEPWKSWDILAIIETDDGQPAAAAEAKSKALDCYLAYRRAGGENHYGPGRLAHDLTQYLLAGKPAAAAAAELLQALAANPELPSHAYTYIHALQAIVSGSRDPELADAPDLSYDMAAEILLLLETLENRRPE